MDVIIVYRTVQKCGFYELCCDFNYNWILGGYVLQYKLENLYIIFCELKKKYGIYSIFGFSTTVNA